MTWKLDSVAITNYVYNTPFQQQTDIVNRGGKKGYQNLNWKKKKKKIKSVGVLGQKAWVFGLRAVPSVSSHSAPTCTMFLSSSPLCQKKRMHITNFQHDQYTISSSITFNFDSIIRWHDDHRGTGQGGSLSLQLAHKARPCTRVHSQHTGLPCRPQTACPPQERHMCYQI